MPFSVNEAGDDNATGEAESMYLCHSSLVIALYRRRSQEAACWSPNELR
ncbi:MAG: hypothetical protein ACTJLL_02470 [Anaplasma sp.]